MEPVARSRGLECDLQIDASVTLETDAALLTRVISNLSDNAIKYNRPGGRITLRLWREDAQACLSVADTGIGIDPAEQAKVFREFYQVGNVARDRTKGLGLGLSIVQRLGHLLGLTVELRSAPDEGTTVTLRLPAPPLSTPGTPSDIQGGGAVTDASRARLDGLRLLVVDDEAQVRDSMALLLSELGGTVFTAEGTNEACDIARIHPLDAVLCDMRLRDGDDGLRTIAALRPLAPQATFALITGDTAPERLREAAASGVPLLHKPVPLAALIDLLQPSTHDAG
jgi:CheY-like chemotaxis protein/anti-sigma regulatory factor (Ser/Thr protein kinase)